MKIIIIIIIIIPVGSSLNSELVEVCSNKCSKARHSYQIYTRLSLVTQTLKTNLQFRTSGSVKAMVNSIDVTCCTNITGAVCLYIQGMSYVRGLCGPWRRSASCVTADTDREGRRLALRGREVGVLVGFAFRSHSIPYTRPRSGPPIFFQAEIDKIIWKVLP